jgi:hypothetical protein
MRTLVCLTLFCGAAAASPPVVPKAVPAKAGEVVTFEVKVEAGKELGWNATFPPADCLLVRLYSDDPAVYSFLAQPKKDGGFGVSFWTVGEKAGATLVVGGPAPAPVPPPAPPPPPDDPLAKRLKAAYDADPAPQKAEAKKDLAELYRQAARLAADPAVRTAGDLLGRVRKAAEALAPGALVGLRKVVAEELAKVLPGDAGEALTAGHRVAAAELFSKLAAALDSF